MARSQFLERKVAESYNQGVSKSSVLGLGRVSHLEVRSPPGAMVVVTQANSGRWARGGGHDPAGGRIRAMDWIFGQAFIFTWARRGNINHGIIQNPQRLTLLYPSHPRAEGARALPQEGRRPDSRRSQKNGPHGSELVLIDSLDSTTQI